MNKKLHELTSTEYIVLKELGELWNFFPEATGYWVKDTQFDEDRIDTIGQNGPEGLHYLDVKRQMIDNPEKFNK